MMLKPKTLQAIQEGYALVLYQDADGVHVGLLDRDAIIEARNRKVTAAEAAEHAKDDPTYQGTGDDEGEDYWGAGFFDTNGGGLKRADLDFSPVWENIAQMLMD
jgi:hypothetical protein